MSYRANVCLVVLREAKVLLLERANNPDNWQFPQGGVEAGESAEAALWCELAEETGIKQQYCSIVARSTDFIYYDIPRQLLKPNSKFKGQKQIWFLLELHTADEVIDLNTTSKPEFQSWEWASYWSALGRIIEFKRASYRQGLTELLPHALKLGI